MNMKTGLSVLAAAGLIFAAAACDFSPSSPFEGFDEEQSQGATLHGQIQQSGVAAVSQQSVTLGYNAQRSLATASDGDELTATKVIVYVDAIEIGSVDIDADGSFTIRGLPEYFTLVFVDANDSYLGEEEFDGVKPNQEIDIVVTMVNGTLTVVEETRTGIDHEGSAGIEIDGTAENVYFESNPMTGSLDVNGYHIVTRHGETSIRKGQESLTLEEISGKQVHVRGVFEGDDVFAFEIKLQEEEEAEEKEGEDQVTLCHIPKGNPGNAKTITVGAGAVAAHLAHGDYLGSCGK